ncbi:branched-chain-amino-acid aminotransferase [Adhaeribacter aerolatus]|uniref:branched-chain-amino-acid transaminase n=1 Tax=Adhaeribacter aerolatus TaxID=670289 RepID=A0A512ASQ5_9BACT|nr:branched-chain amino acid aminotransferase [Adhaeribacter aerolatus]GEO02720.1 branched-chain-amino-acid aminotransferase [Adhaeribacter aerolatus]
MLSTQTIHIEKTNNSRLPEVDFSNLEFGQTFSDHMFVSDFVNGEWQAPEIVPFQNFSLSPANPALHYGQAIFEGLKAYKNEDGEISIFRPQANLRRMNVSADRLCMPAFPEDVFMEGLKELLRLDADWIPTTTGSSLYIRPFMFATGEFLGVKPSDTYRFAIITCPVNAYYSMPLRVKVEETFARSVEGGFGFAKAAGNYAGSLYPAKKAAEEGYHQLLWTDGKTHEYFEESGTMNLMFIINDRLITPALSTSILAGVTRDTIIQIAKDHGLPVEERKVSVAEVMEAAQNGTLQEAFGCGTAAVISHIQTIGFRGTDFELPPIDLRKYSPRLAQELNDIRVGKKADTHGWVVKV